MKRTFIGLFAVAACWMQTGKAQTVEQGKKFYYYERFKSAQETFEKVLAANPNNLDAVYWLGETLVHRKDTRDTAGAKALFQKVLATNGSAPLLLVGMGHIELMQGNTADARQRFETAISLTKAKDLNVLNAVGYANVDTKAGDANYAIEKLSLATQAKNFNNPQTYLLIGDAYRKLLDGGNAVVNYQKALVFDTKLAEAKYKIGYIYQSQNNKEFFLPAYEEATTLDPAYAPAYNALFIYWYSRDVNKAAIYLDKYVANTDSGPEVEYLRSDFLYVTSKYSEARTKAQGLITQLGDKVNPRMYRMIAYTSDTLGDIPAARDAMNSFFFKADTASIIGADYEELARIYSKMFDSASKTQAFQYYRLAIQRDTLAENRAKYANEASELAKKLNNKKAAADMASLVYQTTKNPDQADLYKWGFANYSAGNFKTADSIFCGLYESKYPDAIYGYLWCAKSRLAQDDSLSTLGLAVEPYKTLAEKAKALDSVKYRSQIFESYFYLAGYYNNVKKDKNTAIEYLQKVLDMDPSNETAGKYKAILSKPPKQVTPQPKTKPSGGAK